MLERVPRYFRKWALWEVIVLGSIVFAAPYQLELTLSYSNQDTAALAAWAVARLEQRCGLCEGSGFLGERECGDCGGTGLIVTKFGATIIDFIRRYAP